MSRWDDPNYRKEYHKKYFQEHKEAFRVSRMKFAKNNPEKWTSYSRKSRYGVDLAMWAEMAKNGCHICGQKATRVDHCHSTNTVRGALCNNCNTGLGMFKDDQQLLKTAIYYLRVAERKRLEALAF